MLIAAITTGDQQALRTLYERHAAGMLRLIRRLTSSQGDAEEILQEAWLAVWRSAGSFRGESAVLSWLYGVARRQAHNRLRRAELDMVDIDAASDVADLAPGVEEQVLAAADRRRLATAVGALPSHLREVVALVLVEDLPYQEVAVVLGIPLGTVKSRMSHARARLAIALNTVQGEGARR